MALSWLPFLLSRCVSERGNREADSIKKLSCGGHDDGHRRSQEDSHNVVGSPEVSATVLLLSWIFLHGPAPTGLSSVSSSLTSYEYGSMRPVENDEKQQWLSTGNNEPRTALDVEGQECSKR